MAQVEFQRRQRVQHQVLGSTGTVLTGKPRSADGRVAMWWDGDDACMVWEDPATLEPRADCVGALARMLPAWSGHATSVVHAHDEQLTITVEHHGRTYCLQVTECN